MKETESGYIYEQVLPKHLMHWRYCPQCSGELKIVHEHGPEEPGSLHCPNCNFRHYANPAPTVSMTLLTPDLKKVLLIKRATDPHAGSWALPGGFMDAGEGPQVTARRELDEEAKVSAVEGDLHCLGAWPGLHVPAAEITTVNLHYLGIHDQLSEPVAGSDSLAVAWVPIEDVGELPFKNQRQAWACAQRWIANQVGQAR